MRRLIASALLFLTVPLGSLAGCLVPKSVFISEFVDCLVQMNAEALAKAQSDLDTIDRNLHLTEEKLLKLEQVVTPSLQWIEEQKVKLLKEYDYGSWYRRVKPEGLAKLKNDQYEVTALEVTVYHIGTPQQELRPVLRVFDREMQASREWEAVKNELTSRKAALEQERTAVLDRARLSVSTLSDAVQHSQSWKVRRLSTDIYSISGYGLGMAGEVTEGTWTYYQSSKQAFPADASSEALRKIISGEF